MFNLKLLCAQWASEGLPYELINEHLMDLMQLTSKAIEESEEESVSELVGNLNNYYE